MTQKIHNLLNLLERMKDLYLRVATILEKERACLIKFDFDKLLEIIREKDEVHSAIKAMDRDRLRIQDQFALIMVKDPEELNLLQLSLALNEQLPLESRRLRQLRSELQSVISALSSKIQMNKRLTEKSIGNLQQIASHLTSAIRGSQTSKKEVSTYTGRAKLSQPKTASGSIMEKRY